MGIKKCYVEKNDCFKKNEPMKVKGIMLHSIGCAQDKASVLVNNYDKSGYSVCVHGFIDSATGDAYMTLPTALTDSVHACNMTAVKGWHSGTGSKGKAANANNTGYIGIEMCETPAIRYTGGSSFVIQDNEKYVAERERAYYAAVQLFAELCKAYGLRPMDDGVIISHREGFFRGIASNHADPEHYWLGSHTMNGFRRDVEDAMTVMIGMELGAEEDHEAGDIVRYAGPVYKAPPEVAIAKVDGSYTITEVKTVSGSKWGRLKSGAGWIPL